MCRLLVIVGSLALTLGLAVGCDSSPDTTPVTDLGVNPDGKVPSDTVKPEADGPVTPPPTEVLQQSIMNKLLLPTRSGEYGVTFEDEPTKNKNQLGTLIAAIMAFFPDLQAGIDAEVDAGRLMMLFELFGKSIVNDTNVMAQAHMGVDTDGDASNNFSGSAVVAVAEYSPEDALLRGSISDSKLNAGPGKLMIPLALQGQETVVVTVVQARAIADVSDTGLKNGVIGGALLKSELDTKLLPLVVTLLDQELLQNEYVSQEIKDLVLTMVDTNDDGKIEVADLQSGVVGSALKPDVDTTGDGEKDALSIGVGITSVLCEIQK